jgi:hypothetical protein
MPLDTLRALGTGSEPPTEAKERVAGTLFAALDAAAAATGAAAIAKHSVAPASVHPVASSLLGGVAGSKVLAIAAGIWLFGGVTGAAFYRGLRPQELRVVYVDRPVASVVQVAPSALSAIATSEAAAPVASSAVAPSPSANAENRLGQAASESAGATPQGGSELARERALLDVARADAAHGEPEQVLAVVAQHRRQFPRGRLTEEREALAIRALLSLGRSDEARQRTQAFRAAYPNSFLIPALDSALSTP